MSDNMCEHGRIKELGCLACKDAEIARLKRELDEARAALQDIADMEPLNSGRLIKGQLQLARRKAKQILKGGGDE